MKQILKYITILPVALLLASMFAVIVPSSSSVSALTAAECVKKYDGVSLDTSEKISAMSNDKCSTNQGGPCVLVPTGMTYKADCKSVPAQQSTKKLTKSECTKKYQGKLNLTEKEKTQMFNEGCSDSSGGPCVSRVVGTALDMTDCTGELKEENVYCNNTYTKKSEQNACKKGYLGGESACKDFKGANLKACQKGADIGGNDDSSNGSTNIGQEYDGDDCTAKASKLTTKNCEVLETIVLITNVLSGLAATVIVAMIIVGGIQYSMAGAEAAKVQAAKQKITNALLALMLLIFGFSIIQWLIPGGLI